MFNLYVQKKDNEESSEPSGSGMKNWILHYAEQSSSDESLDSEGHDQEQAEPVSDVIYPGKTLASCCTELNSNALLYFCKNIVK